MQKTGHSPDVQPPEKEHHAKHFDEALKDALSQWQPGDPTEVKVTFEASIAPNPGGIRQYRVTISG